MCKSGTKKEKKKLLTIYLTIVLILTVFTVTLDTGVADEFIGVFPDGINWKVTGLTCGDELIYKVTTSTLDFRVGSAADFNMVVENMPDHVEIYEIGDCWINDSTYEEVYISVYGDEEDDAMNASLHVEGAGLDFTIDEDDEVDDSDYLLYKEEGYYEILISPKTGGTISITATNESDDLSVTKEFQIKGLRGMVTTSVGDDLEIPVESQETITVAIQSGDYADVKVSYFDENWDVIECEIYAATGDGETEGKGLDGIFTFDVEDEDIEDGVGYMVVVANAADLWMYEIIEITINDDSGSTEIINVKGGFGLKATIKTGDEPATYNIYIEGNILFGSSASGNINANTEKVIRHLFSFGLGKVYIVITADYNLRKYEAFMIGPFFFNLEEIYG